MLLLPGDAGFTEILHSTPPPGVLQDRYRHFGIDVVSGLYKPLTDKELLEYLYGGEYEELGIHDPANDWDDGRS